MASKFCAAALQGTKFGNLDDEDQIAVEKATGKPELLESVDVSVSHCNPRSSEHSSHLTNGHLAHGHVKHGCLTHGHLPHG